MSVPTPKRKRSSYRRRLTPESRYSIREYAALTAETLWAWNRLHSMLFDLFCFLLRSEDETSHKTAYAIWHMFQSDKSQREMILEIASAVFPLKSARLKQIKWLLTSANKIAPFRNAVVHVPVYFQVEKTGFPNAVMLDEIASRAQARQRLKIAGSGKRFWDAIAGDLFVLSQFGRGLLLDEAFKSINQRPPEPFPSPHRPRLLSLRRIAEIERQMSLPQANKAPVRRKRASKGKLSKKGASRP